MTVGSHVDAHFTRRDHQRSNVVLDEIAFLCSIRTELCRIDRKLSRFALRLHETSDPTTARYFGIFQNRELHVRCIDG